MTPEEIRSVRQRLGLSQVEAGELIGGGPRAFTKYEAGTVTPNASVFHLLKLLEANPTALASLRGRASHPRLFGAASPFDVTGANVSALAETLLPELLRLLLHAEEWEHGLPLDRRQVASNFQAPDGREDGRIEWNAGPDSTQFLPSGPNLFQLKSGNISPAAAARAVLNSDGAVKDWVRTALAAGGSYILICAQPYTQNQIEKRESRIRKALASAGLVLDRDQVAFRDADQIAGWVNHHPAVATWLKERTQPGTMGPFRTWSHWAERSEHYASPWVQDERLGALCNHLREHVTEPRTVIRIVGLYGVGKSRLTLEALGPDGGLDLHHSVMYTVRSEAGSRYISRVVQILADAGTRAVVVIDDCDPETHQVLARIALHRRSRLSMVTIDNEVPTGALGGNAHKIGEADPSVTEGILRALVPSLPDGDRIRLTHLSAGFPEMAVRLAQAWNASISVVDATSDQLVDAYVAGRTCRDRGSMTKSAALLAVFGLVRIEPRRDGQLCEIAKLDGALAYRDFHAAVMQVVDGGVAQRHGDLVTLKPLPIAMKLAERQWREWSPDTWDRVLSGDASTPLKLSAAEQLARLDGTDIAQEVTAQVCRQEGPFDGIDGISQDGHARVLSSLAEIHPAVVLSRINDSIAQVEDLSTLTDDVRRQLVWALEKIASHRTHFHDGARHLLRLATADELQSRSTVSREFGRLKQAAKTFCRLFSIHLGGTEADGNERLLFLDEVPDFNNPIEREIVAQALATGLQTSYLWQMGRPEAQGPRPALTPWQPATGGDVHRYVEECALRLARLALKDDEPSLGARSLLGDELFRLVQAGFIDAVAKVVRQVGNAVDYWPEALKCLWRLNDVYAEDLDPEISARIKQLAAVLQPKSPEARIRSLVTEVSWDGPGGSELDSDSRFELRVQEVRRLAEWLAKRPKVLIQHLPQLSRGRHAMSQAFGTAIAELAQSPLEWLEPIVKAVEAAPVEERNHDLLTGFAVGLAHDNFEKVDAFKRKAARSTELAPALPWLCWRLGITPDDIQLVIGSLEDGLLNPSLLNAWSFGQKLADVPPQHLAALFDTLLVHSPEGFAVAAHLMERFSHHDRDRLEDLRPQVLMLAEHSSRWKVPGTHGECKDSFRLVVGWLLRKGKQDTDAWAAAIALAKAVVKAEGIEHQVLLQPVLPRILSDLPEVSWPIIGQAIVSDRRRAWHLGLILGHSYSLPDRNAPLLSLPESALVGWCHGNPDHAPAFVAEHVPVLTPGADATGNPSLHPIIVRLLDEFGDRDDVLQGVDTNIHNFGWRGSKTTYFACYKQPLQELLQHKRPKVRRWARTMLRRLDQQIDAARKQDEEREAQWSL